MGDVGVRKAAAVGAPAIALVVVLLFLLSFFVSKLLDLPFSLALPLVVRIVGGAVVVAGLAIIAWVFAYRSPAAVIASTYVTFSKLIRRVPIAERGGRTEPLVISGPQKYARNPLYFGVIVMVFGWTLLTAYTFVLVATLVILLWFRFVIIPFEERELRALFGEQYTRYADDVPMLFPFTKRRRRRGLGRALP